MERVVSCCFSQFIYFSDIEKRKSFADMKLAEVATGGQQWNFEDLPEEPSTTPPPCDETTTEANDEATEDNYKNGTDHNDDPETDHGGGLDMHCNGHEAAAEAEDNKNGQENEDDFDEDEKVANSNNGPASAAAATPDPKQPLVLGSNTENKPDPVTELAPHLSVKIADLGNACWVVR